jgi:hypothetical protein
VFFAATCRSRCSTPCSESAGPQSSGAAWRISAGTIRSISASRLPSPTTSSIAAISAGEGPMWRRLAKS